MIRKMLCIYFLVTALLSSIVPLSGKPIYTGYTEDGIYYEVYEEAAYDNHAVIFSDEIRITRTVEYNGNIVPPRSFAYSETIKGTPYSGTLSIKSYKYNRNTGKTIAKYSGVIKKEA